MSEDVASQLTADLDILDTEYTVSDDQRQALNDRGWTSLPDLLSRDVAELVRQELTGLKPKEYGAEYAHMSELFAKQTGAHAGAWQKPFVTRVATSRRVAGAALQLTGQAEAVLADDIRFVKEPGCPMAPFHQDHPQFPFDRKGCVTLWIALVDIAENMGPLRYLNESHRDGLLGFAGGEEMLKAFPELAERTVGAGTDIAAGSAFAHWDTTVHGTAANEGTVAREAWAVRFIRPDTVYNGVSHVHYDKFNLTRGDRFGDLAEFPLVGRAGLKQRA